MAAEVVQHLTPRRPQTRRPPRLHAQRRDRLGDAPVAVADHLPPRLRQPFAQRLPVPQGRPTRLGQLLPAVIDVQH